jgi:hypothetical protein
LCLRLESGAEVFHFGKEIGPEAFTVVTLVFGKQMVALKEIIAEIIYFGKKEILLFF